MFKKFLLITLGLFSISVSAEGLDTGDTAWMLTSTALVLFMTLPGLALFYAGLVTVSYTHLTLPTSDLV